MIGATLFAVVLWAIVSLSQQFDTTFDVALSVETPPYLGVAEPLPAFIKVRVRSSGWNLLKMLATNRMECVLRPLVRNVAGEQTIGIGRRELLAGLRTGIADAQGVSVSPDSLTVVLGPVARRTVALSPEVVIDTRKGFQVVGAIRLAPDSVTLIGARKLLDQITSWPTDPLHLEDVHRPVTRSVAVSDTLHGIVTPLQRRADLYADVQEVAERYITDIPIINRGTVSDTSLRTVLQPSRVEVLLRGGVRDLGRVDRSQLRAYVQVMEGADFGGMVFPQVPVPAGVNVTVVSIKPSRVRVLFRREASVPKKVR